MRDLPLLVTPSWLAARLGEADLRVIDAAWHPSDSGRRGRDDYAQAGIGSSDRVVVYDQSGLGSTARSSRPAARA